MLSTFCLFVFFFFNDTATTEIYTLSLHDALPISVLLLEQRHVASPGARVGHRRQGGPVAARSWERERGIARQPSAHDVLPIGGAEHDLPDVVTPPARPPQRPLRPEAAERAPQRRAVPGFVIEGLVVDVQQQRDAGVAGHRDSVGSLSVIRHP